MFLCHILLPHSLLCVLWRAGLAGFGFGLFAILGNKKAGPATDLLIMLGAGNGIRTREWKLGKLLPYHLAIPAYAANSITEGFAEKFSN